VLCQTYEKLGLIRDRKIGKHCWVVTRVTELGSVGGSGAGNPDHDSCIEIVRAVLEVGINFIDTSNVAF
jgi:aryl-alcohol dehydrogenase-like predicted oxidoreductase